MPMYSYTCPDCGWQGNRTSTIADRDEPQLCGEEPEGDHAACPGLLTREEIPADQGRMGYNWSKWVT